MSDPVRSAVVNADNIVENIIVADDTFVIDGKEIVPVSGVVQVGWVHAEGVFSAPSQESVLDPVPFSVTPLQMRKALRASGLHADVLAYVAGINDEAQEAWEYATVIERGNPLIVAAAQSFGKTDEEIDAMFRLAASL